MNIIISEYLLANGNFNFLTKLSFIYGACLIVIFLLIQKQNIYLIFTMGICITEIMMLLIKTYYIYKINNLQNAKKNSFSTP
jgi:hypothetical protein